MEEEGEDRKREKREDTAFGAGSATGEPRGTVGGSDKEMAFANEAAIGSTEEEGFRPIPKSVKADGKP